MKKDEKRLFVLYGLFVFIGMLIFFIKINPLTVYDLDDWLYIYELRKPIPTRHEFNPTRVFPETFMPFVSYFGAWVINPLVKNYYLSLTIAHALFAAVVATIYFVQFTMLFYRRRFSSAKVSIVYGCLFILLHFISHIFGGNLNFFLLSSINLTGFYFYTLPALICASLVMHFMSYGGIMAWVKASNWFHKLIVVCVLYFAINSNLYSSVILATYVGSNLLLDMLENIRDKSFDILSYCKKHMADLVIIACWFGANALEFAGGRASGIKKGLLGNIPITLGFAAVSFIAINIFITIFCLITFICWRKKNKRFNSTAIRFLCYVGIQELYLILLSATVEPYYLVRPEVSICNFFYIFTAIIACFNELVRVNRKYNRILLVLVGTIVLLFIHPGNILKPYNFSLISYEKCEALTNDFIRQIEDAKAQGQDEMVLVVPKFNNADNWPYNEGIGVRIAEALYRHKVLDYFITVKEVVISEEKNEEFGINPDLSPISLLYSYLNWKGAN